MEKVCQIVVQNLIRPGTAERILDCWGQTSMEGASSYGHVSTCDPGKILKFREPSSETAENSSKV